ncbi:hypothetical protein [Roseisolibacter agri]|uniref:Lipoprotein n=1 Tax=Roseisolibacter agri TaxID=2014610 RepID=A0AA37V1E1_9BACT|nr:hypothetical protein [Roseisolibacter agri]GLC23637.1 hypothetical protein rosag_01500 [Roseisolibacter agri]
MRGRIPSLLALAALAGCSSKDRSTSDTAAAVSATPESAAGTMATPAPATPAAAAPISLGAVAGRWDMRAVPESGDTTATTYVMTATADSTGWMMAFPDRAPVKVRIVSVAGDSIVAEAGPYASVRRRGVQVTTHSVMRMQGDRIVGRTVAHYKTSGPDSVLQLRTEGTRRP